jgi:hypothetical protein
MALVIFDQFLPKIDKSDEKTYTKSQAGWKEGLKLQKNNRVTRVRTEQDSDNS